MNDNLSRFYAAFHSMRSTRNKGIHMKRIAVELEKAVACLAVGIAGGPSNG
jgi:hypothetical protein